MRPTYIKKKGKLQSMPFSSYQKKRIIFAQQAILDILVHGEYVTESELYNRTVNEQFLEDPCCICKESTSIVYFMSTAVASSVEKFKKELDITAPIPIEKSFAGSLETYVYHCCDNIICSSCLESYRILPLSEHKKAINLRMNKFFDILDWYTE